jgi:hypothetical protein
MELRERPPRHKALFDWKPLSANSLMRPAGSNSLQIPFGPKVLPMSSECNLCVRNGP